MKELALELTAFTKAHSQHTSSLQDLELAYEQICITCASLHIGDSQHIKYLIKKIQCEYLLAKAIEINKIILESAKQRMFTAVEALSRIAIEYAVNIIYITEGEDHFRAKSLLQHYIDDSMRRAKAWKKHAEESGDSEAISAACWKMQYLESIFMQTGLGLNKAVSKWPGAKDRFKAIGS